jgi:hypothetical protein
MFCYSSLLIETGFADEVNLNFLVVGHTHCNLDQEFSFHSKKIDASGWICSPLAMQELYLNAHKEHVEQAEAKDGQARPKRQTISIQLQYLYDWKSFFAPVINKNIKYFQVPHRFKLHLVNGRAICQYMLFTDETLQKDFWLPPLPAVVKSSIDPILEEGYIKLHELAVVNSLPDLKR